MPFSASYDRATKIISALVCLFLLGVFALNHSLLFSAIALLVILISFAYSPRGYVLADRSILVQRLAGEARIALDGIREARRATPDDFRRSVRLWGSGGLFGYYGLFRSAKLGKFTAYVTNRSNRVVVITDARTAVFSPDDVDGFLDTIRVSGPVPSAPTQIQANAGK